MVRNDILQKFPDLFGAKKVNGRDVNVQDAITTLTRELRPEIAAALSAAIRKAVASRALSGAMLSIRNSDEPQSNPYQILGRLMCGPNRFTLRTTNTRNDHYECPKKECAKNQREDSKRKLHP